MKNERFTLPEADDDIVEFFKTIVDSTSLPDKNIFLIQFDTNLNKLIQIKLIPDVYGNVIDEEVLVLINPRYYEAIADDKISRILMEQELVNVVENSKNGKIKITKPNFVTSIGLVNKYKSSNVSRAIEIESLLKESLKESDLTNFNEKLEEVKSKMKVDVDGF